MCRLRFRMALLLGSCATCLVVQSAVLWAADQAYRPSDRQQVVQVNAATVPTNTFAPYQLRTTSYGVQPFELRTSSYNVVNETTGFRGALETTLQQNPGWNAAKLDVKVADRQVLQELLKFTPVITGSLQSNFYSTGNGRQTFDFSDKESYYLITASLPVWTSGSRYYSTKAARSRRDSVAYQALSVRDQTTMQLIEAWAQAIAYERERHFSQRAVERLTRLKKAVTARRNSGFASASDVAQLDADIAAAKQSLSSIKGAIMKARGRAIRLSGQAPHEGAELPRFTRFMNVGFEAFIESAHRKNPQLQAAAANYWSERYNTRAAIGRLLPSVNLTGEYRKYMDKKKNSTAEDGITLGVRLQVPLVDLSAMAGASAQNARQEAALYRESAALDAVEQQIESTWTDYQTAISRRADAKREVAARKRSAEAARSRFTKGFGTLDEAIRAETSYFNSQRNELQLAVEESMLAANLLITSGMFDASMLD